MGKQSIYLFIYLLLTGLSIQMLAIKIRGLSLEDTKDVTDTLCFGSALQSVLGGWKIDAAESYRRGICNCW